MTKCVIQTNSSELFWSVVHIFIEDATLRPSWPHIHQKAPGSPICISPPQGPARRGNYSYPGTHTPPSPGDKDAIYLTEQDWTHLNFMMCIHPSQEEQGRFEYASTVGFFFLFNWYLGLSYVTLCLFKEVKRYRKCLVYSLCTDLVQEAVPLCGGVWVLSKCMQSWIEFLEMLLHDLTEGIVRMDLLIHNKERLWQEVCCPTNDGIRPERHTTSNGFKCDLLWS